MKRLFALLLAILLLGCLAACGQEDSTGPTTSVSAYKSEGEYTQLNDPLSWEDINAFPIKSADMSIQELRQLCVDFFRYSKTACWIPDDNYTSFHDGEKTKEFTQTAGTVYGGVPYIPIASGNIYRIMDYMDPETAVVDIKGLGQNPQLYGNQCSIGAYWGWARVINSADYEWTQDIVVSRGFPRVGPYVYPDYVIGLSDGYRTTQILAENGRDTMYESYALLKAGDGIVYYTSAGHVVMIATDAVVVRDAAGKIDPKQSYVTVIDQTPTWSTAVNAAGDQYTYESNVDAKWSFDKLFTGNYMPFTYAEWLGTDPIEETECTFSHKGDTITVDELYKSSVTCNYGLSDAYAIVKDSKGNEIFKTVARAHRAGIMELEFRKHNANMATWGTLDDMKEKEKYTLQIVAQIGTGERPTLWEGTLTK